MKAAHDVDAAIQWRYSVWRGHEATLLLCDFKVICGTPALAERPFYDRVRGAEARLTDADNRAIQTIMDDPRAAALLSVSELANRAHVHEATATRLAQKLGCRGFPAMRQALPAE
jgi:Helix-turn-helix domain, rpiR family